MQLNCTIVIAAESAGRILLQKEFPGLTFVELRGYRMSYSRNKFWMPAKLLWQAPKLIHGIFSERSWLKRVIEKHKVDIVISDNRLGLSQKNISCVYITHQLKIITGNRFTEWIAQKIHYHFINKYQECWVPDASGKINLAGELSHPHKLPDAQVKYLGPLSRFEKKDYAFKYDLCIILSGPEPQRTVLENILLNDLQNYRGTVFLLRGLPGEPIINTGNIDNLEIKDHLSAVELNRVVLQSKIIISRSGYTTIMDLVKLQKKAILIPTPGQPEQEYLGDYLHKQKMFFCVPQKEFSLLSVLEKAIAFNYSTLPVLQNTYDSIIENFVKNWQQVSNKDI